VERLVRAALELFSEQGYDRTTVAEIAARAGLTKSTFFRHSPDKREILFLGQGQMYELLRTGIAGAPADATPLEMVAAGLDELTAVFSADRRDFAPQRRAVIAAHPELQEREALKRRGYVTTIQAALRARGVEDPAALVAGELGGLAVGGAYVRWSEPGNEQEYGPVARQVLGELYKATVALA
jgi:AcrR family transcriptional regulator